jgi:hypothetical protein
MNQKADLLNNIVSNIYIKRKNLNSGGKILLCLSI